MAYQLKLRPLADRLRARIAELPVPGVLELDALEWSPSERWFGEQKNIPNGARVHVVRLNGRRFLIRSK